MEYLLSKIMNRSKSAVTTADEALSGSDPAPQETIQMLPSDPSQHETIPIIELTTDESPANNPNIINNNKIGAVKKTVSDKFDVVGGNIENSGSRGDCPNSADADDKSENVDTTSIPNGKEVVKNSTDISQNRCLEIHTDLSKLDKERSEISSTSDNYSSNVLPDIVNVQPNVISIATDTDDSLILALTSNLTGLQIGTPKGGNQEQQNLQQKSSTVSNLLVVNCDAQSAVSSDDEVFSECQTYNEANAMDDGDLNRSIHWENVVSSVTTGTSDSLDNTLEQIEPSTTDLKTDLQTAYSGSSDSSEAVASSDSDLTINKEVIVLKNPKQNGILNEKNDADTTCNAEPTKESISVPPAIPSPTQKEKASNDTNTLNKYNLVDTQNSENKNIPEVRIEPVHRSPSKSPPKQSLNGTFDSTNTRQPISEADATFSTNRSKSPDKTVNTKENSPVSQNNTFVTADKTLNGTFNASINAIDDTTNIKSEKCHDNELKAAFMASHKESEPMEVDDLEPEGISPSFNSTQVICKGDTPEKSDPNSQGFFFENVVTDKLDVTFKAPNGPAPQGNKRKSLEKTPAAIDDSDFSPNGMILNPSDFDFLLSKGNNTVTVERSSLLLKFDPLVGQPVPVTQQQHQLHQQGYKSINSIRNVSHFETSLTPALEEDDSQPSNNFLHDQFALESNNDTSRASFNCTVPVGGGDELSLHSAASSLATYVSKSDTNVPSTQNPPNYRENPKLLKERLNRRQPEEKKSNAKMSVDVIQDMKIENDTKSIDHINSQADEKHGYKMAELEKKIKNETLKTEDVEKKLKEAEQREEALLKRIAEKDRTISKMSGVLEAYEKAIAELIAEKEQITQNYEKQLAEVKSDRDQNYLHLTSLETTFSDLHAKYERSKQVSATLKTNEEILLAEKRQNLENLRLQETRYDKMKNHAMQQLEIANNKLETLTKNHSGEVTKLKALLKKEEISRLSLTEQLLQKTRENEELVKICDELINGQGSS